MKMKDEREKVGLKLNIQKTKITASGPITSWQIDGKTVETVTDFILGGLQNHCRCGCNHEIKSRLLFRRKSMTNLYSILKSRDIFSQQSPSSESYGFSSSHVWIEGWTIKKAEDRSIDAFDLWCWRRLLRVPWTARRSNPSILKEVSPEYSLERLMLKLKLQYFGHLLQRTN